MFYYFLSEPGAVATGYVPLSIRLVSLDAVARAPGSDNPIHSEPLLWKHW